MKYKIFQDKQGKKEGFWIAIVKNKETYKYLSCIADTPVGALSGLLAVIDDFNEWDKEIKDQLK